MKYVFTQGSRLKFIIMSLYREFLNEKSIFATKNLYCTAYNFVSDTQCKRGEGEVQLKM